jgi:hypothetical protein
MPTKNALKVFLSLLLLTALGLTQEVPDSNPDEVWVKGRKIGHSWRNGKIFVDSSALTPLLNMQFELPSVDLLKALEEKGGYITRFADGRFEAVRDQSRYQTTVDTQTVRAQNREAVTRQQAEAADRAREEAEQPRLSHEVRRFVAETGFVRAYVRVTNTGGSANDSVMVVADFTDGYGKAFARDTRPLGPLQPGEYQDFEMFSLIDNDEMIANGVIRTVNNEKVRITFRKL